MKLQKLLLILMSLVLVVTSSVFVAFAQGDTETATNESANLQVASEDTSAQSEYACEIVETGVKYETYDAAATAVEDGQTIKLFNDITLTSIPATNKKVTIDGNGNTITQSKYYDINSLTIKNATYTNTKEFGVWAGTLTLDNVTWNHNAGYGVSMPFGSDSTFLIKNSTVISASDKALIYVKDKNGANITIEDSTVTYNTTSNSYTAAVIYYKKAINVSLKGNTTFNWDRNSSGAGSGSNALFFSEGGYGNFEVDNTVVFNYNKGSGQEYNAIWSGYVTGGVATIVDHGATYNVSQEILKAGFSLDGSGIKGEPQRGTKNNIIALRAADGTLYSPAAKFATDFEAGVSLKAYTTSSFITNNAATADAEAGTLRFPITVDKDFYAAVKDNATFGMEIVAGALIDAENGVDWANVEGLVKTSADADWSWNAEGEEYTALIKNITDALKETKFAVCGFVTVEYADGNTATFYADHTVALAASLA